MILEGMKKVPWGGKTMNVAFSFRASGEDLVVLLHGLGGSKEDYGALRNHEALHEFSLLSFDFPGFGDSDKPEDFSYAMEDQAMVCGFMIRQFGNHRLHLAAHSMAGAIALLLPENLLQKAISFANLEGNLIDKDCFLSRKVVDMGLDGFRRDVLPKMRANTADDPILFNDVNRASPMAYYESAKSLVAWSDSGKLLDAFRSLRCSKAYFYGARNRDIEPLRVLKDIKKIEIEKSGHMMMLENPMDFCEKLARFFRG